MEGGGCQISTIITVLDRNLEIYLGMRRTIIVLKTSINLWKVGVVR